MLSWLDSFWRSATGFVSANTAKAVHWAEHAIAGVVLSVFRIVGGAWNTLVTSMRGAWREAQALAEAVWAKFAYILRHVIPAVLRWASAELAKLSSFLSSVWLHVLRGLAAAAAALASAVSSVTRWALRTIWAPLKAYADSIWHHLTKWGFTAWWWITHLDKLADAMVLYLARALEKKAWTVARMLSTFTLALLRANLRRVAQLAEDVITAVF